MSFSSDFTITTLSESLNQRSLESGYNSTQAPYRFGGNYGVQTLRDRNTPYLVGIRGVPTVDEVTFTPTPGPTPPADTVFYTEIVSASNPDNTTPLHVGSIYLEAQTYSTIGALITDIGSGGENVHFELKRFTGGSTLLSLTNDSTSGPTWGYVTGSDVVVSNSDWYDIYISSSASPATSSIRGIYYEI